MTYTCNKKAYPQFSKDCQNCSEYNPCAKGGKWCFVAAMENERMTPDAHAPLVQETTAPILAKHDYRNVKIAQNTTVSIDLEKLKENMKKSFFQGLVIQAGR